MVSVIKRFAPSLMPAALAAGSFVVLLLLMALTNPADKIAYAMFFFLFLLIFLTSGGYWLTQHTRGGVSYKARYRIFVLSLLVTVLLMFRSAQSLGWLEIIVLIALTSGLLFYGGRRL